MKSSSTELHATSRQQHRDDEGWQRDSHKDQGGASGGPVHYRGTLQKAGVPYSPGAADSGDDNDGGRHRDSRGPDHRASVAACATRHHVRRACHANAAAVPPIRAIAACKPLTPRNGTCTSSSTASNPLATMTALGVH